MTDGQDALRVTRIIDAPREEVWKAWTDPDVLARWWWPARFQTSYDVDLRVGGQYTFRTIDLPNIGVLAVTGTYLEVRRPGRLVYTWRWERQDEPPTRVMVDFVERGSQTELHIVHQGFATEEERENHVVGWSDCLDRLHALSVPGKVTGGEPR
jgi:uncharacterized protein YndB with AHSA1/START domain